MMMRVTGVFLHAEGHIAGGGVVDVHPKVFVFFASGDAEVAVDAADPFNYAGDHLGRLVGNLEVVHVPRYHHLESADIFMGTQGS